jgi:hypothetical protein
MPIYCTQVFADKKELEHHSRHTLTFEQLHTRCLTFPEPALAKGVQTQRLGEGDWPRQA